MIEIIMDRFASLLRAPTHEELADAAGIAIEGVPGVLQELHDQRMIVLEPGTDRIWMANPFSAVPTEYVAVVDGRRHFGNCIWDALGIVAMLGGAGRVEKGELSVDCAGDRVRTDPDHLVHFLVPAAHWWDDIGFT